MAATSVCRPPKRVTSRTLIVVDMQDEFMQAGFACLDHVLHEITLAKERGAGIVVLEYRDCGKTVKEIRQMLKGYKDKVTAIKVRNGGGDEFFTVAEKKRFNTNKVRVCGVNRAWCVKETVEDLLKMDVDVEVAINATWCGIPERGRAYLRDLVGEKKFVRNGRHLPPSWKIAQTR